MAPDAPPTDQPPDAGRFLAASRFVDWLRGMYDQWDQTRVFADDPDRFLVSWRLDSPDEVWHDWTFRKAVNTASVNVWPVEWVALRTRRWDDRDAAHRLVAEAAEVSRAPDAQATLDAVRLLDGTVGGAVLDDRHAGAVRRLVVAVTVVHHDDEHRLTHDEVRRAWDAVAAWAERCDDPISGVGPLLDEPIGRFGRTVDVYRWCGLAERVADAAGERDVLRLRNRAVDYLDRVLDGLPADPQLLDFGVVMWEWARKGTHLDDPAVLSDAVVRFAASERHVADDIASWADGVRGLHDVEPPSRCFVAAARDMSDELTDEARVALWADGQALR